MVGLEQYGVRLGLGTKGGVGGGNDDRPAARAYVAVSPGIRSCRARRSGHTQHATLQGTEGARRAKHVGGVVAGCELPHDPAENFRES